MSWWKIAWRSMEQRGLASLLTSLSMALGVMLVVLVLTVHGVIADSFKTGSSVGYHIIVGAKGGSMQLVLNTVFYLSKPIQTIPYDFYLNFANKDLRESQMRHSAAFQAQVCLNQSLQMQNQLSLGIPGGGALAMIEEATAVTHNDHVLKRFRIQEDGTREFYASMVIPVCLGDSYGDESEFTVIATTPAFFNELEVDVDTHEHLKFREGRAIQQWNETNGVFEAVVGAEVAAAENLKLGDPIYPIHGDIATGGHLHKSAFTLVGILEHSGTRNDAGVFVNLEGFYLMDDHVKPLKDKTYNAQSWDLVDEDSQEPEFTDLEDFNSQLDELEAGFEQESESATEPESSAENEQAVAVEVTEKGTQAEGGTASLDGSPEESKERIYLPPLPIEQRELTALLIRGNDETGAGMGGLENAINENGLEASMKWSQFRNSKQQIAAQAVNPLTEVYSLFELFVLPIQRVLLAMTVMICIVSGVGILVSIYNSMSERKQEIAIMRALGAGQTTVMGVILTESLLLSAIGGLTGWIAAHLAMGLAAPYIKETAGVHINALSFAPAIPIPGVPGIQLSPELLLVPGLMLLAVIVGLLPAISAYRTDVSENLN